MANPYRELFCAPGTIGFSVSGLIGRLPLPMTGIGIITMLSQLRGSYALAGGVAAAFIFTNALMAPQISRLVDRSGQGKVLPVAAGISLIGFAGLAGSSWLDAPNWLLFCFAFLIGFMPSMSAMTRARWTAIYRGGPQLQIAHALETVFDDISFVVGPPISVGLSLMVFPQAALIAAAAALALGVLTFAAQRQTEPPHQAAALEQRNSSVITNGGIVILALLMVAMGVVVGVVDIGSVAFAERQGQPAAASIVLSAYAAGSCLAGLVFGAFKFGMPLPRLLLIGGLGTAATTLPLILVSNVAALAIAMFIAGLFFAPTMIVAMTLVERLVPEAKLTEGLTWLLSGLNTGGAIGAAVSGQVVDIHGVQSGFGVAIAAGVFILLIVFLGQTLLPARLKTADAKAAL